MASGAAEYAQRIPRRCQRRSGGKYLHNITDKSLAICLSAPQLAQRKRRIKMLSSTQTSLVFQSGASLHQASASTQSQSWDDAYLALIEKNGITSKWVATPFWCGYLFPLISMRAMSLSVIAALTLSVNGALSGPPCRLIYTGFRLQRVRLQRAPSQCRQITCYPLIDYNLKGSVIMNIPHF